MFTNKVNTASFVVGKEKVNLTQEFEEMLEAVFY